MYSKDIIKVIFSYIVSITFNIHLGKWYKILDQ